MEKIKNIEKIEGIYVITFEHNNIEYKTGCTYINVAYNDMIEFIRNKK